MVFGFNLGVTCIMRSRVEHTQGSFSIYLPSSSTMVGSKLGSSLVVSAIWLVD